MMRLFGQMILLPFTVFVFGIELFARTIRELQKTTDRGMDLLVGETAPLSEDLSTSEGPNSALSAAPSPSMTGGWGDLKSQTTTSTDDGVGDDAEVTDKETTMRDKDLSDDQLKLVRYKILFVKRDYETAFPEQEELVADLYQVGHARRLDDHGIVGPHHDARRFQEQVGVVGAIG